MAMTEAQKRAQKAYKAKAMKQYSFSAHRESEADLIAWLDAKPNRQGYLKGLIREDMARRVTE